MTFFLVAPEDMRTRAADVSCEMAAHNAAENARIEVYEVELLKAELLRVLENLYAERIDFATAIAACRLLGTTAENLILSQEEADALSQLWQDRIVTWRETLLLTELAQNDRLRQRAALRAERLNSVEAGKGGHAE